MLTIPRDREFRVEHTCYDDVELTQPTDLSAFAELRAEIRMENGTRFPIQCSVRDTNILTLFISRAVTYTLPLGRGQTDVVGITRVVGGFRDETLLPLESVEVVDLPTEVDDIERIPDFSEIFTTALTTGPVPLPL